MHGNISHNQENHVHLEQIYFYLTAGCNLACRHCWLSPKLQDETHTRPVLPFEIFTSILEQGQEMGIKAVKLTGGEPLMHPGIAAMVDHIKKAGIDLSIESNGVLCSPAIAEKIASCKDAFISISLDGADARTHESIRGIKGCFNKTVNGIKNLVKAGVKPQVIFTVMAQNKHQIKDIIQLADSLDAESIKFNIVQPTGRGKTLRSEGESIQIEELLEIYNYVDTIIRPTASIRIHFDLPVAFRPLSRMFGKKGDGCATCGILKIIGVLADGNYALCGIGSHIPELVFGHAGEIPLDVVWENNPVLLELREGIPAKFNGVCGNCHMKRVCSASCIAQNVFRSNSLWEAFWFCEEAYQKGLFPQTRLVN